MSGNKLKNRRIQDEETSKKNDTILLKKQVNPAEQYKVCRKTWPAELDVPAACHKKF